LRPFFWIAFAVLIILSLFIYGLSINKEKSELQKAKLQLSEKNQQLTDCVLEKRESDAKINEQALKINEQKAIISENEKKISGLRAFSSGYGKLTIYSQCTGYSRISVTVDNDYWGTLDYYFTGQPNCGQDGTISKFLTVGKHRIRGRYNRWYWDYYITIEEGICNFTHFSD